MGNYRRLSCPSKQNPLLPGPILSCIHTATAMFMAMPVRMDLPIITPPRMGTVARAGPILRLRPSRILSAGWK